MQEKKPKIIVILGPTASGKSNIAIRLARKFDGEIISADSRQIYRGMDIGSGKVTEKEKRMAKHWMLDIASPDTNFSAAQFKKKSDKIIVDIIKRGKLPIICGGTGFWIRSIVDDVQFPEVKPDWRLRKKLHNKSAEQLFKMLKKIDLKRSENIDAKNKVRLIRAIEICKTLGKVPNARPGTKNTQYDFLQIGISIPRKKLHERIKKRLDERFREGMVEEVRNLHYKQKISWKRLESFGLEYRDIALYLQNEMTEDEMKEKLFQNIKNYAKRQMTWFRSDKRIRWLGNYQAIKKSVGSFIKK